MKKPMQRNTVQKSAVLETVLSMRNHPTADMVYDSLHEKYLTIGKATVYRVLGQLSARGDIRKVSVPDGADRYDFRLDTHYHIKCAVCGRVDDAEINPVPELEEPEKYVRTSHEYRITGAEVIFEGICAECLDTEKIQ